MPIQFNRFPARVVSFFSAILKSLSGKCTIIGIVPVNHQSARLVHKN